MSNQSQCSACGLVSLDIDLVRVGEGKSEIVMCPGCRSEGTMGPISAPVVTEEE